MDTAKEWKLYQWALMGVCGWIFAASGIFLLIEVDIAATMDTITKWTGIVGTALLVIGCLPSASETISIFTDKQTRTAPIFTVMFWAGVFWSVFDAITNREYIVNVLRPTMLGTGWTDVALSYVLAWLIAVMPEFLIGTGIFLAVWTLEYQMLAVMKATMGIATSIRKGVEAAR